MGELKNEWEDGVYGVEFYSTGVKSYGVLLKEEGNSQRWIQRHKGIKLNAEAMKILKPQIVLDLILDEEKRKNILQIPNPHQIRRNLYTGTVTTQNEMKKFRLTLTKRVLDASDMTCAPYGWFTV